MGQSERTETSKGLTLRRQTKAAIVALSIVLAACASTPTGSVIAGDSTPPSQASNLAISPSATPASLVATSSPVEPRPATPPTATASTSPLPTAAPTPVIAPSVPGWTTPTIVEATNNCGSIVAAIDPSGRDHIAAQCDDHIRYFGSTPSGSWTTTDFAAPPHRLERAPRIAFRGNVAYLAYTRVALVPGGCGASGMTDVGVYYRIRTLPAGAWSSPVRFGVVDDGLESFQADGSTLHATVLNASDGRRYYEAVHGSASQRYFLPDAIGPVSLRIGSDGHARIAYEAKTSLRYGTFTGSGFRTAAIPGTSAEDWAPQFVLDRQDHAHLLWTHSYHGRGCAGSGPTPKDGTYYATDATGTWRSSRLTTEVQSASLQYDEMTGQVDVLRAGDAGLTLDTMAPGGPWTATVLMPHVHWWAATILRLDPANGALLAVYTDADGTHAFTRQATR